MAEKKAKKEKKTKKKTAKTKKKKSQKGGKEIGITITKKMFGETPRQYHFRLSSGETLSNLFDLADSFGSMSEETFRSHVNDAKNDFSTWVEDVLKENDLAQQLNALNQKIEFENACLRKILQELKKLREETKKK